MYRSFGSVAGVCLFVLALPACSSDEDGYAAPPDAGWHNDATPQDANDAGEDAQTCTPVTCASLGAECGTAMDGCGDVMPCGTCEEGETCGAGGPNRCGVGECEPQTCAQASAECGLVSNGCAGVLNCGGCTFPNGCATLGHANVCECVKTSCEEEAAECGTILDGCGGILECGECATGTCGGGGTNRCGTNPCSPKTCTQLEASCGWASDGCASAIACGECIAPDVCGGGGVPNQCGCEAKSCLQVGASCGEIDTGCGVLDCGTCTGGDTCGGGGLSNACGCTCDRPHAITDCVGGKCSIEGCLSDWHDCDGYQGNGCEARLDASVENCGACGNECSFAHASAYCDGACHLDACTGLYEDCDGVESNGCERSINTETDCGSCGHTCGDGEECSSGACRCGSGPGCGAGQYCHQGQACYDLPTISFTPSCADLGVDHLSPDFVYHFTVHGRPGATAEQYNEHVSCGEAPFLGATYTIDAFGSASDLYSAAATVGCSDTLGHWEVYVMVDGHESNHVFATYYNGTCPGAETCAAADSYCP